MSVVRNNQVKLLWIVYVESMVIKIWYVDLECLSHVHYNYNKQCVIYNKEDILNH